MMDGYTDKKGKEYIMKYENGGDVVILSEDNFAWKVQKSVLKNASSFFRNMFEKNTETQSEIHLSELNTEYDLLGYAILAIIGQRLPDSVTMDIAPQIITLLLKYECTDAAKAILYHSVREVKLDQLYEAFVLASQLDDMPSACRILPQGWRWYEDGLDKDSLPLSPLSSRRPWTPQAAGRIKNTWVWALSAATRNYMERGVGPDFLHTRAHW